VILGCSALLFGVLAVPLAWLAQVDLFDFDLDLRVFGPPGPTLAPLPAAQCAQLRRVRDAGNEAYRATSGDPLARDWLTDRARTEVALARYEFILQSVRASVPPQIAGDFEQVAHHVHAGRVILARSANRQAYIDAVTGEVLGGFGELNNAGATLGSACGEHFTFWPAA
jgi:hypothetical protein